MTMLYDGSNRTAADVAETERARAEHRRGPFGRRRAQDPRLEAERVQADRDHREREREERAAAFRPAPPTAEQLEAQAAAAEQAKDYATRRRQFRSDIDNEIAQLDHDLAAAVATLDVDGFCAAHARRVALLELRSRLAAESAASNRLAPARIQQAGRR